MREMQFTAIVLMTLLTMKLLLLPRWAMRNPVMSKARWLMTGGTALLAVQFLLQFRLELRSLDVTKAVMLNLAIFIPCAALMSLGILFLLQQGRVSRIEKYIGIPVWLIAMALMTFGSSQLLWAEIGASFFYAAMQLYYSYKHFRQLRTARQTLANYYDREPDLLLSSMQVDITLLALMSLFTPAIIFGHGWWLAVFAIFFLMAVFYLVDSFCLYAVSSTPAELMEAEQNEEEVENEDGEVEKSTPAEAMLRVESAVAQWTASGGHLKSGLKLPNSAEEMQIPRYLLSAWLKQKGLRYNDWLTEMRIDEAKRLMKAHPDWSNEAIAQQCGFSDRSYFQKKFKDITSMTPAQYIGGIRQWR